MPEYPGYPIDPPLRSRFQGRYICGPSPKYYLEDIMKKLESGKVENMELATEAKAFSFLRALSIMQHGGTADEGGGILNDPRIIPIPETLAESLNRFTGVFPHDDDINRIIKRLYPYHLLNLDKSQNLAIHNMLKSVDSSSKQLESEPEILLEESSFGQYKYVRTTSAANDLSKASIQFECRQSSEGNLTLSAPRGTQDIRSIDGIQLSSSQHDVLSSMMQSHCLGHDICLVGKIKSTLHKLFTNTSTQVTKDAARAFWLASFQKALATERRT